MEYNSAMGTLGGQEMLVILVLALLIFGPKELPKVTRAIAKAITEFQRVHTASGALDGQEMLAILVVTLLTLSTMFLRR
jgi:TatA/E family protein of Tat protein translocase